MHEQDTGQRSAQKSKWVGSDGFYKLLFGVSVTLLVLSFTLALYGYAYGTDTDLKIVPMHCWPLYRKLEVVTLVGWIVIPPLFFWIEFFGIYCRRNGMTYTAGCTPPTDWERFKYTQDLSAKVWLAVSTALFILYFGKDIKL